MLLWRTGVVPCSWRHGGPGLQQRAWKHYVGGLGLSQQQISPLTYAGYSMLDEETIPKRLLQPYSRTALTSNAAPSNLTGS